MSLYRDACGPLERRRAELAQIAADLATRSPDLRRIRGRRVARIVAGILGVLGAATLPLTLFFGGDASPLPSLWLAGTVAASLLTYFAGRVVFARLAPRTLRVPIAGTDLAALEASNPWPRTAEALGRLESWSLGLPLVAASLLGPLTLHGLLFLPFAMAGDAAKAFEGFRMWIALSCAIVGHAHIALAICSGAFAKRMARTPSERLGDPAITRSWLHAFLISAGVSALPGVVLFAIPPIVTLLTGLVLVPTIYALAHRTLTEERRLIDSIDYDATHVRVGIEEIEAAREELEDTGEPLAARA